MGQEPHATPLDIAIVGAGAAGLMAGIWSGRSAAPGTRIALLDGAKRIGTKILVAGGGRCNVTHDVVLVEDYCGPSKHTVKAVLDSFPVADTVEFFRRLGVELKREDTGKLFPTTDKAATVLGALTDAAEHAGARILTRHRVQAIERVTDHFLLQTEAGVFTARRVILAAGGRALPGSGSDGGAYKLVQALGHSVTDTWPALVALTTPKDFWPCALSGLAFPGSIRLESAQGKLLASETGDILLTHFGLSGPAPMNLSRHLTAHRAAAPRCLLAFWPVTPAEAEQRLLALAGSRPKAALLTLLRESGLPDRLAEAILRQGARLDPAQPAGQITRDGRKALVTALTSLPVPVSGDRGFDHAECTAGGVPLVEVNTKTMESRKTPGLHLAGEILDCDGRIGGYNFQWAWCTGRLAGLAAADG